MVIGIVPDKLCKHSVLTELLLDFIPSQTDSVIVKKHVEIPKVIHAIIVNGIAIVVKRWDRITPVTPIIYIVSRINGIIGKVIFKSISIVLSCNDKRRKCCCLYGSIGVHIECEPPNRIVMVGNENLPHVQSVVVIIELHLRRTVDDTPEKPHVIPWTL